MNSRQLTADSRKQGRREKIAQRRLGGIGVVGEERGGAEGTGSYDRAGERLSQ